ncbi:hypothetical protein GXP67_08445 [Rhodocytophaga rosea]|uniref:Histidine kinase domain-containing protein n=1 Tax=Rhodocytophaga rosea TaxID=2704465 RepID=A0A6C0GFD3_9BACT|nr:sensor histidine kinase [Rhodocytophaga rosea]QHT66686.1 hypothetical protein GXP67_08445 [Rhodocytophaga rosea]
MISRNICVGLVFFLLHLFSVSCKAQLPSVSFEVITTKDGLPSNTVFSAARDQKGFIWFGTRLCPTRYDGASFRNFLDFETNLVTGLAADKDNNIWLASDRSGICKIGADSLNMTAIPSSDRQASNKQTGYFFIDSYGKGWYSNWYGVSCMDLKTGKFKHYPFRQTTYVWVKGSFIEDRQHNLWVIGRDNGLFRYDRQADTLVCVLGADAQDPKRRLPIVFTQACMDQQGILWIGTHNYGLIQYDPQTGNYVNYSNESPSSFINSVEAGYDENGKPVVWWGDHEGLGVFRPEQKKFYRFSHLLPDAYEVHDIFRDKTEGIVWVCTSDGILKYNPKSNLIQTIAIPDGIVHFPVVVNTFLPDKTDPSGETFWLGLSHTGMLQWNRRTNHFMLFKFPPEKSSPETRWMIQREDGKIWIGVNQWRYKRPGIIVFNPENKQFLNPPLSRLANQYYSVPFFMYGFFDRQKRLWIGNSDEGIHVLDSASCKEVSPWDSQTQLDLIKGNNLINDMRIDKQGRVWLGTYKGVYYVDEEERKFVYADTPHPALRNQDPAVNTLLEDHNGNIWAARWGSITQTDKNGVIRTVLTSKEGLSDRENRGLAEDKWGNIWIGNYEGLHYYNPVSKKLLRFTVNDGLLSNNTLQRLFVHAGNELFIGQKNGINLLKIDKLSGQPVPPPVAVSSFKIHEKEQYFDFSRPVRLKRSDNAFSVDFSALNYSKLQNNQYAYYLEGFDKNWNYIGSNHLAYYTNLDPDTYTLYLKAGDAFGNWNQNPLRIQIVVLPAFYETWWFRLLIVAAIAAILYALYRYRINQLLRLQQIRNRISADLHDEIGASLSGISIMGMMAKKNLQEKHPSALFLERMVEETNQISSSLDDIVWSINPKNDDLSHLTARMTRYASELLEAKGIAYKMNAPDYYGQVKLSMEQRRDFYLIFKEALNNLAKYAQCSQAWVEISLQRHCLQLVIRDNGIGFEPHLYTERNGLRNMRKRAENLKGTLLIQSAPGEGTMLQLSFPISA